MHQSPAAVRIAGLLLATAITAMTGCSAPPALNSAARAFSPSKDTDYVVYNRTDSPEIVIRTVDRNANVIMEQDVESGRSFRIQPQPGMRVELVNAHPELTAYVAFLPDSKEPTKGSFKAIRPEAYCYFSSEMHDLGCTITNVAEDSDNHIRVWTAKDSVGSWWEEKARVAGGEQATVTVEKDSLVWIVNEGPGFTNPEVTWTTAPQASNRMADGAAGH